MILAIVEKGDSMSADNRKSILITGGGGGMGLETGRCFAAKGWLVGLSRNSGSSLAGLPEQRSDSFLRATGSRRH